VWAYLMTHVRSGAVTRQIRANLRLAGLQSTAAHAEREQVKALSARRAQLRTALQQLKEQNRALAAEHQTLARDTRILEQGDGSPSPSPTASAEATADPSHSAPVPSAISAPPLPLCPVPSCTPPPESL
jgi:hypothetical protein